MTPGKLQHLFDSIEKVSCGSLDHIHAETGTTYIDLIYCDRPNPEQLMEAEEMQQNLCVEDGDCWTRMSAMWWSGRCSTTTASRM